MGFNEWIGYNWLALVQTGALAGGLLFTGMAVLLDARARRVGNLIQLTQQHRDLWERLYLQFQLNFSTLRQEDSAPGGCDERADRPK